MREETRKNLLRRSDVFTFVATASGRGIPGILWPLLLHLLQRLSQPDALADLAALLRSGVELLGWDVLALLHAQFLAERTGLFDSAFDPMVSHGYLLRPDVLMIGTPFTRTGSGFGPLGAPGRRELAGAVRAECAQFVASFIEALTLRPLSDMGISSQN